MQALRAEILAALGREADAATAAREALDLMQDTWVAGDWRARAQARAGERPPG
jgi:hypothetical protein